MKRRYPLLLMICMLMLFGSAQKPVIVTTKKAGWQRIGQITASLEMDKESLILMGADVFKAIKLRTREAALQIESLQVSYESGEMEDIPVKYLLKEGEETKVMEVKQKGILKVTLTYKTIPTGNRRAVVELWGMK